ncbi:uncharacterized protein [Macrobrachium rosenbergii]|uniref:uncharacterized protein n=1 Tax=Macrobrachium rosenbergii TaxID=79674 RepID=UPI0034D77F0C
MQTKGILFIWGIVASLVLLADGSANPAAGEIAAKFEEKGSVNLPSLEEPTEKVWLEIIEGTLRGGPMPKYLAERNYTFQVNETGAFSTTEGAKGSWNLTAYVHYRVAGNQSLREVFHIEELDVGDLRLVVGLKSAALFTLLGKEPYVSARAVGGETFVNKDGTLVQAGSFLGFGQGDGVFLSETQLEFSDFTLLLVNSSNSYSVSEEQYGGLITVDKEAYQLQGGIFRNSIPLSSYRGAGLPKTPEALARLYRESELSTPFIYATAGTVTGEQTVGLDGKYSGEIDSVTRVFPDRTFNATATIKATFRHEASTETHLQLRNLLDTVANSFLH